MSVQVLVVCTANQCRSPVGAAVLSTLAGRRPRADSRWCVTSAGVAARDGAPAVGEAVRVGAAWGADLSGHRARRLDRRMVQSADLVVTMETRHLTEVLRLDPGALARSFAWLELARLSTVARVGEADLTPQARLRAAVRGLHRARPLVAAGSDDVVDPMGGNRADFSDMGETLASAAERFLPLLVGGSLDSQAWSGE